MRFRLFSFLLPLLLSTANTWADSPAPFLKAGESVAAESLRVSNHHPFPIREPVQFLLPAELANGKNLLAVSHSVSGGTVEAHYLPVQIGEANGNGAEAWIDVQLRPGESRVYTFQDVGGGSANATRPEITDTFSENLPARISVNPETVANLFGIALVEVAGGLEEFGAAVPPVLRQAISDALPIEATLVDEISGPVKSTFVYAGTASGENDYALEIRYHIFSSGIVDISLSLQPTELRTERIYLAVLKTVPAENETAAFQTDGKIASVKPETAHASVNWLAWDDAETEAVQNALLVRPAASPLATGDSVFGAPLIEERLIATSDARLALTEIVGTDQELAPAETVFHLRYRVLPANERSLAKTDEAFAAFAGFHGRHPDDSEFHVTFGSAGAGFSFDYSPRDLFGDNAENSADEIRRDFRIANALGLQSARVSQKDIPLVADAARETGIELYLADLGNPEEFLQLAETFADAIGFAQLPANLSDENADSWQQAIDRIRSENPEIRFAAPVSPDSFPVIDRFKSAGIDVAAFAQTIDGNPEIPPESIRNAGILLGGHATRHGKWPIAALENLKFSSQTSDFEQANNWYRRFHPLLANGSISLLHQGELVPPAISESRETRKNNPAALRLDRTPTVQASALHHLIGQFGHENHPANAIEITLQPTHLRPGETAAVPVALRNRTNRELEIRLTPHLPAGVSTEAETETVTLRPRQVHNYNRILHADENLRPGFYHVFEEAQFDENVRFGWTWLSHRARPEIDLASPPAADVHYAGGLESLETVNLANLRHILLGNEASETEINAAAQLQDALRLATGADIRRSPYNQTNEQQRSRSLVLVGTPQSNPAFAELAGQLPQNPGEIEPGEGVVMIIEHPDNPNRFLLIISGKDEAGVSKAAADFADRLLSVADGNELR